MDIFAPLPIVTTFNDLKMNKYNYIYGYCGENPKGDKFLKSIK